MINAMDRIEKLEHDAWMEENPLGSLKAFQAHLDKLSGKAPQQMTVETLDRMELKRLRRLYAVK